VGAAVLAVSAGVAIALVEAWARTAHPFGIQYYVETNRYLNEAIRIVPEAARPDGRIFENRPSTRLELVDFEFCTDAAGLRAPAPLEATPPPGPERLRLLFLGDSVTLGWGVDDEDTWIRTLEREGRAADGRSLTTLNAGHLMYNTVQQADWLDAHGVALAPDAVVLTFVTNDVEDDHWALYQEIRSAAEAAAAGAEEPLSARLTRWWTELLPGTRRLYLFTRERAAVRSGGGIEADVDVERLPGYEEGWARCERALERVRARCASLGVPLLVLDHTTPRIPAVRRWCERNGVSWADLSFTAAEWAEDVRVSAADSHANSRGHRYQFEKARAALVDAGLLAPAATEDAR